MREPFSAAYTKKADSSMRGIFFLLFYYFLVYSDHDFFEEPYTRYTMLLVTLEALTELHLL